MSNKENEWSPSAHNHQGAATATATSTNNNNNKRKNEEANSMNGTEYGSMPPPDGIVVGVRRTETRDGLMHTSGGNSNGNNNYVMDDDRGGPQCDELWEPTGIAWRDFMHFVGPGWFVSIAYVDPGNYQADILAGASSQYTLLFAVWWTSILSIYVQILCVRLAYYSNLTLAEAQYVATTTFVMNDDGDLIPKGCKSSWHRYMNWAIAEFSVMITDLPEVIGFGIACHIFFGWPYYVGVMLSLLTTMLFLALQQFGIRILEFFIFLFVGIMSVALWIEMGVVGVRAAELWEGWVYGFVNVKQSDIFAIVGILGSVVMPHNLYLHSAACRARKVRPEHVQQAVKWGSWEPVGPIIISFFVNMAIVAIATDSITNQDNQSSHPPGLTTFCSYLSGGCVLWGIALMSAGQSSAITTTFTGQYVMDGFLKLQIPTKVRAIVTRLVTIIPCVLVSIFVPEQLNQMVNFVNAALSILLPFALTPLVRYNCSPEIMGPKHASRGCEKYVLYGYALVVWAINAMTLSVRGGGFFGNLRQANLTTVQRVFVIVAEVIIQLFYAWWNIDCVWSPIPESRYRVATTAVDEKKTTASPYSPPPGGEESSGDEREVI